MEYIYNVTLSTTFCSYGGVRGVGLYGKEREINNPPNVDFIEYQRFLKGLKWYGQ
jgi:hypothetical protein